MEEPFFTGSVPLPPSVNQAYRVIRVNDHYRIGPSAALVQFKRDAPLLLSQAQCNWAVVKNLQQYAQLHEHIPLEVSLKIYFETMWRSDLDGREKYAVDSVFAYLNLNDNLITRMTLEKCVDRTFPRIEVSLALIR